MSYNKNQIQEPGHAAFVVSVVVAVTLAAVALLFMPDPAPVRQDGGPPKPAAWEVKAWADSHCDRCGKGLTPDPQDGTYIIGGQPYWLHKGCVGPVVKAARR